MQARKADTEATSADDIEHAGALALESLQLARESKQPAEPDAIEAARSALIRLPACGACAGQCRPVAGGAGGREARQRRRRQHQNLAQEGDRRSGGSTQAGQPGPVAGGLPDGRLASGGDDGNIEIWPEGGTHRYELILKQGSPVLSLAVLPDGRLASGGNDGNIKIWPEEGTGRPWCSSRAGQPGLAPCSAGGRTAGQRGQQRQQRHDHALAPGRRRKLSRAAAGSGRWRSLRPGPPGQRRLRRQHQNLTDQGGDEQAGECPSGCHHRGAGGYGGRAAGQRRPQRHDHALAQEGDR